MIPGAKALLAIGGLVVIGVIGHATDSPDVVRKPAQLIPAQTEYVVQSEDECPAGALEVRRISADRLVCLIER